MLIKWKKELNKLRQNLNSNMLHKITIFSKMKLSFLVYLDPHTHEPMKILSFHIITANIRGTNRYRTSKRHFILLVCENNDVPFFVCELILDTYFGTIWI